MNTAESRIEFVPENVVSGTPVLSKEPFCVDVREHQLDYRIKSEGKVCWKNTQYLVLEVMIQASSRTFIHVFFGKGRKTDGTKLQHHSQQADYGGF